jgi:hypothetical protein
MNLRSFATKIAFLFSFLLGAKFVYLANGDVVNHYPYISPDGFDWYTEGVYLVKLFGGASLPELPVLRPPLFVFVTAADYVAGSQGWVLAGILGLSTFYTYYFSLKIVDLVYEVNEKKSSFIVPLLIGTTIYPLNFIKPFILADSLAISLSLASVFLIIKYHIESKKYLLVLSIAIAIFAGTTQTYALIPYFISCFIAFVLNIQKRKNLAIKYFFAIITVTFLFILLSATWRFVMPHASTPQNFVLLKFNTNMLDFYLNTWGFYFLPLILFFLIYRGYNFSIKSNIVVQSSMVIFCIFSLLCFFYQWPEARFTYYLWPWLLILFFSIVRIYSHRGEFLLSIFMFAMVIMVPLNYWIPSLQSVRVSMLNNWVGDYFSATPIDRKLNICSDDCSKHNEFLKSSDSYVNSTVNLLIKIKILNQFN